MRKQKLLAALLALVMVVTLLPLTAFAVESEAAAGGEPSAMSGQEEAAGPKPVNHESSWPEIDDSSDQPFPANLPVAGADSWRIPNLITLNNNSLFAVADSNWNESLDGANIDVVSAISQNNGKNWQHKFLFYFDDTENKMNWYGATFMDAVSVQDSENRIYVLADCYPGAVAIQGVSAPYRPTNSNGYEDVNGEKRLVLYSSGVPDEQRSSGWTHYIGEFGDDGFAPVIEKDDSTETPLYYVDHWYYLYDSDHNPLYTRQLGAGRSGEAYKQAAYHTNYDNNLFSGKNVQANVFFWNDALYRDKEGTDSLDAPVKLHVRGCVYLWLRWSDDNGQTWSEPSILNPQVYDLNKLTNTAQYFLGVGPGRGVTFSYGGGERIVFPVYQHPNEYTYMIYSDDQGKTWSLGSRISATSSEAPVVEIGGVLYTFPRGNSYVYYSTDGGVNWLRSNSNQPSGIQTSCQHTAVTYPTTIDGKPAILLASPTNKQKNRTDGKVWIGLVDNDTHQVQWEYEYSITQGRKYGSYSNMYAYSCITVLDNGNIGLLWEDYYEAGRPTAIGGMRYDEIPIRNIAPSAIIDGKVEVSVPIYKSTNLALDGVTSDTQIVNNNQGLFTAAFENGQIKIDGLKTGTGSFTVGDIEVVVTVNEEGYVVKEIDMKVGDTHDETFNSTISYDKHGDSVTLSESSVNDAAPEAVLGEVNAGSGGMFGTTVVPVSNALFTAKQENGYWVFSAMVEGTEVYLHVAKQYPTSTSTQGHLTFAASGDGTFTITDSAEGSETLAYIKTAARPAGTSEPFESQHFDMASRFSSGYLVTTFSLYTTTRTDTVADIPALASSGYYKVTGTDDIKDGSKYIIVAQSKDFINRITYAMLYPSTDQDYMHHCAKITGNMTGGITTTLTATAEKSGVTDVVIGNSLYRYTVKEDVTEPTIDVLPADIVTVECGNKYDSTASATYDAEAGGVTINWTTDSTTATATVDVNYYVNKYNTDNPDVVHNPTVGNITLNLSFADGEWSVNEKLPVVISVTCDTKPAAPTEDDVKELLGDSFVTFTCDNENGVHDEKSYGWLDDAITVSDAVNDSDNDGVYEAEATINIDMYLDRYDADTEYEHTLAADQQTNVKVELIYEDGWKLAEGATPVTVNVICTYEPSEQQPDPPVVTPPAGGDTELPEDQTPMNPTPDDGDTDIDEGDTPLAPAPDDTDIPDGDTPLDSTPKTGDASLSIAILWSIFSMSAIGFASVMLSMKKAGKHTK